MKMVIHGQIIPEAIANNLRPDGNLSPYPSYPDRFECARDELFEYPHVPLFPPYIIPELVAKSSTVPSAFGHSYPP